MLAEEIWQIAEGFVEDPVYLLVQLKKCGKNIKNVDNFVEETLIIPQCGKQLGIFSTIGKYNLNFPHCHAKNVKNHA